MEVEKLVEVEKIVFKDREVKPHRRLDFPCVDAWRVKLNLQN